MRSAPLSQFRRPVNDHVAMQDDRVACTWKLRADRPIFRNGFVAVCEFLRFLPRPHEILKLAASQLVWIRQHQHVIQSERVMMPFVDRTAQVIRCEIQMAEVQGAWCGAQPAFQKYH